MRFESTLYILFSFTLFFDAKPQSIRQNSLLFLAIIISILKSSNNFNKYILVGLMKPKDSDQSDNQGFVPNQIKIDSQSIHREEINHTKSNNFEAHYIVGQGLMRKQPPEAIKSYSNISRKPRTVPIKKPSNDYGEDLPTVHELYNNKSRYSLVYSRFKQPFGFGQRCAFEHQIKLNCCEGDNEQYFKTVKDWDQKCLQQQNFTQNTLLFDSLFEGGNLRCAFKQKKNVNSYVLFMQNDSNTYGYNQWFYFSIRNAKQKTKYTFKIANFKKPYSFYNNGLQPLVFSLKKQRKQGEGWYRDGVNISYSPSNFKQSGGLKYYTLQFSLQFDYSNDFITLSPNPPYSYTKLITTLKNFETIATTNKLSWKLKSVSNSIAQNQVPYVIISNKQSEKKQKKKIVLFARQHPGEIWSSFLIEEIMLHLIERQSLEAKWLLQQFDFHIFPMINVDGVIYGNFRSDIAGNDLNRTWKSPLENLQPQIYKIKKEVMKLSDDQSIQMCLDLHTHSKDYGIFGYCCVDNKQCRQFPLLLSKCTSLFRYGACTFGIAGQKQLTARASVFGMTNNVNTVTIELSAYGYKVIGRKYAIPYTPAHIKTIARNILKTYYAYKNNAEPAKEIPEQQEDTNQLEMTQSCQSDISNVDIPVEGSDSEPQADEIELEVKMKKIYPTRFVQDIEYSKFKKRSKNHSKKFKKLSKQSSTIKYQSKLQKKLKAHSTQVKQEVKFNKSPPLVLDELISSIKDEASSNQGHNKNVTFYNHRQPLYKKQNKPVSEKTKKPEAQKPAKPLNLIEFSLKKLPIFPPQKIVQPQPNPHILLNQLSYISGFNPRKKQERFDKTYSTYEAMVRPRVRIQNRKLGFQRDNSRLQQQLPFLCIMSQTKKQIHLEKSKQKSEQRSIQKKTEVSYLINGHRPDEKSFMKYRDKQKQIQLFSKIGLENYTRYAQNTFFRKS